MATSIRQDNTCANCGAVLTGLFCAECGQKSGTERLNVVTVIGNSIRTLFEFDSKIWATMRDFALNPGSAADSYINGSRVKYVNPIKYFVTTFTISLLVTVATGEFDRSVDYIRATQDASMVENSPEVSEIMQPYFIAMEQVYAEMVNIMTFLVVPLFALFIRMQNFRSGRNYAEILCFTAFVWGQVYVFNTLVSIAWYPFDYFDVYSKAVPMVVIYYYGSKVFFKRSWIRNVFSVCFSGLYYFIALQIVLQLLTVLRMKGII